MGREIQVNSLEEMCDLMCGGPEDESTSRFEAFMEMDEEDVAKEICDYISERIVDCKECPYEDRCYLGHNGVLDYLMEIVRKRN